MDNVGETRDIWREDGSTLLLHQDCPVVVSDSQIVPVDAGGVTIVLNVDCGEFQPQSKPFLHLDRLRLVQAIWIVVRVIR